MLTDEMLRAFLPFHFFLPNLFLLQEDDEIEGNSSKVFFFFCRLIFEKDYEKLLDIRSRSYYVSSASTVKRFEWQG